MKLTLFWWSSHYGCILDSSLKNPDADEHCQILQLLIPSSPRTQSSTGTAWTSAPLPVDHTSFVPSLGWSRSVPISTPPSKLISVTNSSQKPPLITSYPTTSSLVYVFLLRPGHTSSRTHPTHLLVVSSWSNYLTLSFHLLTWKTRRVSARGIQSTPSQSTHGSYHCNCESSVLTLFTFISSPRLWDYRLCTSNNLSNEQNKSKAVQFSNF